MEIPTTPKSTLGQDHRLIPGLFSGGHVYAEGWISDEEGHAPYISLSASKNSSLGLQIVSLRLTPADARELAQQLTDSATFCDEVQP